MTFDFENIIDDFKEMQNAHAPRAMEAIYE